MPAERPAFCNALSRVASGAPCRTATSRYAASYAERPYSRASGSTLLRVSATVCGRSIIVRPPSNSTNRRTSGGFTRLRRRLAATRDLHDVPRLRSSPLRGRERPRRPHHDECRTRRGGREPNHRANGLPQQLSNGIESSLPKRNHRSPGAHVGLRVALYRLRRFRGAGSGALHSRTNPRLHRSQRGRRHGHPTDPAYSRNPQPWGYKGDSPVGDGFSRLVLEEPRLSLASIRVSAHTGFR